MIKIDFEFTTEYGIYRDALHLEEDHQFSSEDIEKLKKQRVDNWLEFINNTSLTEEVV